MPQLNETYKPNSNGHNRNLDTDLVTLKTESNYLIHQDQLSQDLETSDDWSFVTKELLDALPQRWTRGLLYFLIVFVAIALPWGMLSKVDETGTAKGRLEPQGGTVKQELNLTYTSANVYTQTAKVEKVYVEEGDRIEAGDILIELESHPIRDRLNKLQIQRQGQENRLSTLEQQKNQLEIELRTQERQNQSQQLEKLSQVDQARQNHLALKTTYNLQKQETLAKVYQAEQNLAALRRTLNLQREEKLAQVQQAKQQLEDSKTAYELSEIRWEKALGEVERYRQLFEWGAVPEEKVVEKEDIAKERQRIWEQTQADLEQAKLRIEEQESSYQRVIHQVEADIEQAELRLAEQQSSYDRMINQAEADIEQAELRLAEQKSSYDRIIHQSKADIQQAELRLAEQENNSQTLGHSGEIALSKIQEQLKNLESKIGGLRAELAQTKKEIDSFNFELEKRVVRAEEGGTIFDFPIEGVGDVVQQGEMIVEIAPKETNPRGSRR